MCLNGCYELVFQTCKKSIYTSSIGHCTTFPWLTCFSVHPICTSWRFTVWPQSWLTLMKEISRIAWRIRLSRKWKLCNLNANTVQLFLLNPWSCLLLHAQPWQSLWQVSMTNKIWSCPLNWDSNELMAMKMPKLIEWLIRNIFRIFDLSLNSFF